MKITQPHLVSSNVAPWFAKVQQAVDHGDVVLDFSEVERLDSSAVSLLLHASRAANTKGLILKICNCPAALKRLVALYGLETLFSEAFFNC